jgi:hypothetical protein
MEIIETGFEINQPFIRRYYWYRGKTNYRPPVVVNRECGGWSGINLPLVSKSFKSIDKKEFVTVQPMTLGE